MSHSIPVNMYVAVVVVFDLAFRFVVQLYIQWLEKKFVFFDIEIVRKMAILCTFIITTNYNNSKGTISMS